MEIAYSASELTEYMSIINRVEQEHPILVDKYVVGKEIEVDAICDGEDIIVPGIMEHIERAGIHSGDSISLYPAVSLSDKMIERIMDCTKKLALGLDVKGLVNIQYIVKDEELYVIEVNPRSSRTVPYISKVTGLPMVDVATKLMFDGKLTDFGYGTGLYPSRDIFAVKVPVFSFEKLPGLEVALGPEMKSTGEVLGLSKSLDEAVMKGLYASNIKIPRGGAVLFTIADNDKDEAIEIASGFESLGFELYATVGTKKLLEENGINCKVAHKLGQGFPDIIELIHSGSINLVINTPSKNNKRVEKDGFSIRRATVESAIPCVTSLDTAKALLNGLRLAKGEGDMDPIALQEI
jgi:carbamoyl-phosphate synthase large subunit